jgi:hypothetical protein
MLHGLHSILDRRTIMHPGYAIRLSRRWLVEKGCGWLKQIGTVRQVGHRSIERLPASSPSDVPASICSGYPG